MPFRHDANFLLNRIVATGNIGHATTKLIHITENISFDHLNVFCIYSYNAYSPPSLTKINLAERALD